MVESTGGGRSSFSDKNSLRDPHPHSDGAGKDGEHGSQGWRTAIPSIHTITNIALKQQFHEDKSFAIELF